MDKAALSFAASRSDRGVTLGGAQAGRTRPYGEVEPQRGPRTGNLHRAFFGVLRSAPELLQRGAPAQAAIAEQEVPELEEPHAAPHLCVPAHGMAQAPVGLEERPPDRLGAELYEGFDRLHPQDHPPGWQVAGGEDLVLVVPAPHVVLDDSPAGGHSKVR